MADQSVLAKLTIAIPVYNDISYIRETIETCLHQAGTIWIYDNASTDGTSDVCAEYAERFAHVRHVRHAENIGAFANFAAPLFACETEYFQWVGSHDQLEKDYSLRLLQLMERDSSQVLSFGDIVFIDENTKKVARKNKSRYRVQMQADDPMVRMVETLKNLRNCFIVYGVFRTAMLREIWRNEPCIGFDDALLLRAAAVGKFAYCEGAVFYARDLSSTRKNIDARQRHSEIIGHKKSAPVATDLVAMTGQMIQTVTGCPQYKQDIAGGFKVFDAVYMRYLEPRRDRKARRYKKALMWSLAVLLFVLAGGYFI